MTATSAVTAAPTATISPTQISSPTAIMSDVTDISVPTAVPDRASPDNSTIMGVALGMIALALLGGGVFTWLGNSKGT